MENEVLLTMRNVTKRFKKRVVIESFNLEVSAGELVSLYGPNGVGKSTLMKMIAGIITPTSGTIEVKGYTSQSDRIAYAKNVSYMPDHFQFQQRLTLMEFLTYYAKLRGVSEEEVLQALERVGLADQRQQYVHTLSKGMGQRLLFAQLLFSGASVLLLDEPTNGLDEHWLEQLADQLHQFKQQGKAIILSTHMRSFASELADRMIELTLISNQTLLKHTR